MQSTRFHCDLFMYASYSPLWHHPNWVFFSQEDFKVWEVPERSKYNFVSCRVPQSWSWNLPLRNTIPEWLFQVISHLFCKAAVVELFISQMKENGTLGRWGRPPSNQHEIFANLIIQRKKKSSAFSRIEHHCHRKEYFSDTLNLSDLLSLATLVADEATVAQMNEEPCPRSRACTEAGGLKGSMTQWLPINVLLPHIIMQPNCGNVGWEQIE